MKLALSDDNQKLIQKQMDSAKYSTPEDVVTAALHMLDQAARQDDFEVGDLETLLAEGEASASLDGEAVFSELRKLGETYRQGQRK